VKKNSVPYDVTADSFKYLKYFFRINDALQFEFDGVNHIKLFHTTPLRTSFTYGNCVFDTFIVRLLTNTHNRKDIDNKKKSDLAWSMLLKLDSKVFRRNNNLKFHKMFYTDGYSISLLFSSKNRENTNSYAKKSNKDKLNVSDEVYSLLDSLDDDDSPPEKEIHLEESDEIPKENKFNKPIAEKEFNYFDKDLDSFKKELIDKKIVVCDPGQMDLLYFLTENSYDVIDGKKKYHSVKVYRKEYHVTLTNGEKRIFSADHRIKNDNIYEFVGRFAKKSEAKEKMKHNKGYICERKKYHKNYVYNLFVHLDEYIGKIYSIDTVKSFYKEKQYLRMRYSKANRKYDLKTKFYDGKLDVVKNKINNGVSIKTLEAELSKYNLKSVDFAYLHKAFINRMSLSKQLMNLYNKKIFTQDSFHRYINGQRADARILNNFKKQMGDPDKTIIVFGDYDANENKVYGGPCGSVKFKRLFRDSGYKIYEIDEYYTSKLCSNCESETELFKEKEDHEKCDICRRNKLKEKLKLKGTKEICQGHKNKEDHHKWGLKRCKSVKCLSQIYGEKQPYYCMNRDKNACLNFLKIIEHEIKTGKRPVKYRRPEP
jgi:hypothetical protein